MSGDIVKVEENLLLTEEILSDLGLSEDLSLLGQITEVRIELDGVKVQHDSIDKTTATYISQIHVNNMATSLVRIVEDALGYYALPEQSVGANELPIGPLFARQLIRAIHDQTCDLVEIKNQLNAHLSRSDAVEPSNAPDLNPSLLPYNESQDI